MPTAREESIRQGREWDEKFVAAGFAPDVEDAASFRNLLWEVWEDGGYTPPSGGPKRHSLGAHLPPTVRFKQDDLVQATRDRALLRDLRKLLDEGVLVLPGGGPERDRGLAFLEKLKEAGYLPHEDKKARS